MPSARRPHHNNGRSLTGTLSLKDGRSVTFESKLERNCLINLDFRDDTVDIETQFPRIPLPTGTGSPWYTPDIHVAFIQSSRARNIDVCEVKYLKDLDNPAYCAKHRHKWDAARSYCRERGWTFRLLSEQDINTPFTENALFFRRYLSIPDQPLERAQLLFCLQYLTRTTPEILLATAFRSPEARMTGISALWKMIARREVWTDFDKPFTNVSPIAFVEKVKP
ncbi:MAG: TnsA endonuclease N-terminal domain-containing protein [Planctomycetes bacterium]|nr:TnsA endonuclease N-terminal domain-containing protein [Planctomycetota bacterium]